ncbi:MAG: response regulator [Paracoccaceae bacterium]
MQQINQSPVSDLSPAEKFIVTMGADRTKDILSRPISALVIEDSEFDRKRIARVFKETGLDCKITEIGCLSNLRGTLDVQKFDLVLVDFQLPESDGLEAVNLIRSHPAHLNNAIIMITGQADITVAIAAMKSGCSDYFEKSALCAEDLRGAVLNALEKSDLQKDLMRARGLNGKLEELVKDYASQNASEMKPLVLSLMRQARAQLKKPTGSNNSEAREMDTLCRELWAKLVAMENTPELL